MQDDYNKMVESVNKYKGFYVGRYETGIEAGKAVSKNASTTEGVTTADAGGENTPETKYWYGLYKKQKEMAKDNGLTTVESSMIWGSQYDAMMNWMIKTGTTVGAGFDTTKRKANENVTGASPDDIINQIHDLYGVHTEWTLEAYFVGFRTLRGGAYEYGDYSPGSRTLGYSPDTYSFRDGSRLSMYVK